MVSLTCDTFIFSASRWASRFWRRSRVGTGYHRRFAPHDISLAWLNERQFDFIGPSGYSWPLGRYGYVKTWNVFNLAFASKRTGDPRYLQTSKRDNANYRYNSPWLRMEIPLTLLWYPEGLNERITGEPISVHPIEGMSSRFLGRFLRTRIPDAGDFSLDTGQGPAFHS